MLRHAHSRYLALVGAILLTGGVSTPTRAQDPDDLQRGVARIGVNLMLIENFR